MRLPVTPRASLTAVITASVPELTARTISIHGTSDTRRSAKSTSMGVAIPNVLPSVAARLTLSVTSRLAWPRIIAPQLQQ